MGLKKLDEIRNMSHDERRERLEELRSELMHERGVASMGGAPPSPGRLRSLRHDIARILTIEREMEIAENIKEEK